jgi:hypothetical protein
MDEVRIYNRALSSGEIQLLYTTNLAKYSTGSWMFSTVISGLIDNTYTYTGQARDVALNTTTTGRTFTLDTTAPGQVSLLSPTS